MDDRYAVTTGTLGVATVLLGFGVALMMVPLNLAQGFIPTPILPLVVIFLYGLDRPASLPPLISFLAGLTLDLLFGAAVGPWASVFLLVHAAIIWQRSYFAGRDPVVLTTGFAAACLVAMSVYWFEMSILGGRPMPYWPVIAQTAVTIAVFPLALKVFRRTIGRRLPSLVA